MPRTDIPNVRAYRSFAVDDLTTAHKDLGAHRVRFAPATRRQR